MKTPFLIAACAFVSWAQPQDQVYTISTVVGGVRPPAPSLATGFSADLVNGITTDSAGNVYYACLNAVFKLDASGMATRVAGNLLAGDQGDGGAATSAELNLAAIQIPGTSGLAMDAAGNLYISDTGNHRIRRVTPDGVITTIAGNGVAGFSGDGGPAVAAQLNYPAGLAIDANGNLYVADSYNYRVRKIAASGIITTVASQADGLSIPGGVAADQNGNVYVSDLFANKLFERTPDGTVTTLAQLQHPTAVAVDRSGNVFVSQYFTLQKVSPSGALTPLIPASTTGFSGDGGPASLANVFNVFDLAVDADGNIFIADTGNDRVRKIDSSGIISTVAGDGSGRFSDQGSEFPPVTPYAVALDKVGNIWISDAIHSQILKLDNGGVLTVAAGTGSNGFSGDGGPATKAQLSYPRAIAVDSSGIVFFRDNGNNRIRKIALDGIVTTVAGNGYTSGTAPNGDGGPATSATVSNYGGLTTDSGGNLIFLDSATVREVLATTGIITTIAGTTSPGYFPSSGDGGPAINAHFTDPEGIALDTAGNIFVADGEDRSVRKISSNGIITTIAGGRSQAFVGPSGDGGPAASARLSAPLGVALDPEGNLYIADPGNAFYYGDNSFDPVVDNRIRKVSPDGTITTFAGGSHLGFKGDGGPASTALLNLPFAIATGSDGRIAFVDIGNNAVRVMQPDGHTVFISSLQNGARSQAIQAVSPGEIVNIYGAGLGPDQLIANQPRGFKYDTQAGGTTVAFNGIAAQVLYASANQVGAEVPFGITPGTPVSLSLTNQGVTSQVVTVQTVTNNPEMFTVDETGTGEAVALNPDGSVNSAANPGKIGQVISVFVTGAGQVDTESVPVSPVSVFIGGISAVLTLVVDNFGLTQVSAKVPNQVQPGGYVPIVVKIGDQSTSSAVWIAVSN